MTLKPRLALFFTQPDSTSLSVSTGSAFHASQADLAHAADIMSVVWACTAPVADSSTPRLAMTDSLLQSLVFMLAFPGEPEKKAELARPSCNSGNDYAPIASSSRRRCRASPGASAGWHCRRPCLPAEIQAESSSSR